ncbi:MAG: NADH-quinone oxidoreductase subunit M, partial [Chitinophagia bacterium]|nr:NADH-quinone oxidoreductase subunit M [Chitinophagia bacterium]
MPIVSAIFILFIGKDENKGVQRWLALSTVIFTLVLSLLFVYDFDVNTPGMQYVEDFAWMQ